MSLRNDPQAKVFANIGASAKHSFIRFGYGYQKVLDPFFLSSSKSCFCPGGIKKDSSIK
jgi:hypothetical protein